MRKSLVLHRDRILVGILALLGIAIFLSVVFYAGVILLNLSIVGFSLLANEGRLNLGTTNAAIVVIVIPILAYVLGTVVVHLVDEANKKEILEKDRREKVISLKRQEAKTKGFDTYDDGYYDGDTYVTYLD